MVLVVVLGVVLVVVMVVVVVVALVLLYRVGWWGRGGEPEGEGSGRGRVELKGTVWYLGTGRCDPFGVGGGVGVVGVVWWWYWVCFVVPCGLWVGDGRGAGWS